MGIWGHRARCHLRIHLNACALLLSLWSICLSQSRSRIIAGNCVSGRGLYRCGWGAFNEECNPLSFPDSPCHRCLYFQRIINLIIQSKTSRLLKRRTTNAYSRVCAWLSTEQRVKKMRHGCWLRPLRSNRATLSLIYHEVTFQLVFAGCKWGSSFSVFIKEDVQSSPWLVIF